MAIDQTDKRRDIVSRYVQLAGELDDLVDELARIDGERLQAGEFDEASFQGNEHIDSTDLGNLATRYNAVAGVITAAFARDVLRKARRG